MLPEGSHNRISDSTYFILNRKKIAELNTDIKKTVDKQECLAQITKKFLNPQRLEQLKALSQRKPLGDVKLYQIQDLKWVSFYSE